MLKVIVTIKPFMHHIFKLLKSDVVCFVLFGMWVGERLKW